MSMPDPPAVSIRSVAKASKALSCWALLFWFSGTADSTLFCDLRSSSRRVHYRLSITS